MITCKVCGMTTERPTDLVGSIWAFGVCSDKCYKSQFVSHVTCNTCGQRIHGPVENHACNVKGLRFNEGKPRPGLIPAEVLSLLGRHYEIGARKYSPNNWKKGLSYSETYDSLLRHLYDWWAGESFDEETGSHHLIAVIWNAVALMYFELFPWVYKKFDDRVFERRDWDDALAKLDELRIKGPICRICGVLGSAGHNHPDCMNFWGNK